MEALMRQTASCPQLKNRGERIKMCRWFSVVQRMEQMLPHWWKLTSMWTLLALEKGCFKNVRDLEAQVKAHMPSWKPPQMAAAPAAEAAEPAAAAAAAGEPAAAEPPAPPCRHTGAQTLRVACLTLGSRFNYAACRMLVGVLRPIMECHSRLLTQQKTRRGTQEPGAKGTGF